MSLELISRSPDLKRLRDDGYDIEVRSNYLLVHRVPYVNAQRVVGAGTLVSELTLSGDVTAAPGTHVMHFAGDYPCHKDGGPIDQIRHRSAAKELAPGVTVDHSFSSKPPSGRYPDYYEKVVAYTRILTGPASAIEPSVTATPFLPITAAGQETVFRYLDTASSRAEITMVNRKLEDHRIAIVGVGGTGSYVLDLVAKTPVAEIHLFDEDVFLQHNAFRAPGAASLDDLQAKPNKVDYFRAIYDRMHSGIHAHPVNITDENAKVLREMDFVFLCRDGGVDKGSLLSKLDELGVSYIDAGMGVNLVDDSLLGTLRVTASTPSKRDHVGVRIPAGATGGDDEYATNIQIADLNALNAALAVVRWKKLLGFYVDQEGEHHSAYMIGGNEMINEDKA